MEPVVYLAAVLVVGALAQWFAWAIRVPSILVLLVLGFLGGIYFPIGQLSDGIAAIMKCTPVIYGTALFRSEMTAIVLADTFQGIPAEVVTEFSRIMGIELMIGDHALTAPQELLILLTCGIVFLIWGAAAVRFSKKADR